MTGLIKKGNIIISVMNSRVYGARPKRKVVAFLGPLAGRTRSSTAQYRVSEMCVQFWDGPNGPFRHQIVVGNVCSLVPLSQIRYSRRTSTVPSSAIPASVEEAWAHEPRNA